ncbi:hypothetical protein GCM10029964_052480 [Kibdelosporangium lantanae]
MRIQDAVVTVIPRSDSMVGTATFTIVPSIWSMNSAPTIATSASPNPVGGGAFVASLVLASADMPTSVLDPGSYLE